MGTRIDVQLWSTRPTLPCSAIDAVIGEMRRTDELMSTYKPESQLSRVNAEAADHPVVVDPRHHRRGRDSHSNTLELSNGAFDITYASVGYLYDYRKHITPDRSSDRGGVAWRRIIAQVVVDRERNSIRFLKHGMRIDLGGIAKG